MSRSQTAGHREVGRATIMLLAAEGTHDAVLGESVQCRPDSVWRWGERFNDAGLSGLADRPGPGRPRRYSEQERGQMIALARPQPEQLGQAWRRWSLTRLTQYLKRALGSALSRAQVGRV